MTETMKKYYNIFTSKNGDKYIHTNNKYLAHAASFCGFVFMVFQKSDEDMKIYSFQYSEELVKTLDNIIKMRCKNMQ